MFELFTAAGYFVIGLWIGYAWCKRTRADHRKRLEKQFHMWLEREPK